MATLVNFQKHNDLLFQQLEMKSVVEIHRDTLKLTNLC